MTAEQRAVLAHVVVDPDAWYAHAVSHFGAEIAAQHLAAKVARWMPDYEPKASAVDYKTRAEREESAK